MSEQSDFDRACAQFSVTMGHVASWKHSYMGSIYSTRLRQALNDAREACHRMERALAADEDYRVRASEHFVPPEAGPVPF